MRGSSASETAPYTSALDTASTRSDADVGGRLEHVERALGVGPEGLDRCLPRSAHVGPAGQVVDDLGPHPADQRQRGRRVGDVEHLAVGQRRPVAGDTSSPSAPRWATRWWPTKPLPPVTRALNGRGRLAGRGHVGRW